MAYACSSHAAPTSNCLTVAKIYGIGSIVITNHLYHMKISDQMLQEAVKNSTSFMGVLRQLGLRQAGGTHSHYKGRAKVLGLDTSHFTGQGWNIGGISTTRRTAESILVKREEGRRQKSQLLVRALLENGIPHKCSKCNQPPEWLGNKLTLDVDHINEDWLDDRLENLRFLCPNCHSQFSRNLGA